MVKTNCRGIAILETAIFLGLVLMLLSGGMAIWDYVHLSTLLGQTADSHLQGNLVKPFRLSTGADFSMQTETNSKQIAEALSNVIVETRDDLARKSPYFRSRTQTLYITACYSVIRINALTGRFEGIQESKCPATSGDSSVLPPELRSKDLPSLISAGAGKAVSADDPAGIAAVPDGNRRGGYLPCSVMVGLRIYTSLERTAASLSAYVFRHPPYLYHDRIVTLRGDMR